ncbi:MAG: sigma-54-dependent Fis family transcriptional regulator [Desulfuromusa sp.]|nr:sigma-54-dependent Fis family transcriptional regulator [Desulfuromusa sp.]
MRGRILIVEDEEILRESLIDFFRQENYTALGADTLFSARKELHLHDFDLMILDMKLPDGSGIDLLSEISDLQSLLVIVATAYPEVQTAVRALKLGAFDYINKPFDLDELQLIVERAMDTRQLRGEVNSFRKREKQRSKRSWTRLEGESNVLKKIRQEILLVAKADATTTLILGESGVGKELVVEAIHYQSARREGPLLKINCAALPATLLENELFGHEKGAYTDANSRQKGLFELADHGTLFLDEIAEMEPGLQAKLLRVLEDKTVTRIGGQQPIYVDVRIVAATNRDLRERIDAGLFREDLFYRLNVFPIMVPPLREHPEDIPLLAALFLKEFLLHSPDKNCVFSAAAMECLSRHQWPGNVRELKNVIERTTLLHPGGTITPENLALVGCCSGGGSATEEMIPLSEVEKTHILAVYKKTGNNKTRTADILGINRLTLRRKLKEYGIS